MDTFDVHVNMQLSTSDIEALARVAHPVLMGLAEHDVNIKTELGPGATPRQVADWYSHNPETVVSAIVRAMIGHGLVPFDSVIQIGANTISSHKM